MQDSRTAHARASLRQFAEGAVVTDQSRRFAFVHTQLVAGLCARWFGSARFKPIRSHPRKIRRVVR